MSKFFNALYDYFHCGDFGCAEDCHRETDCETGWKGDSDAGFWYDEFTGFWTDEVYHWFDSHELATCEFDACDSVKFNGCDENS